MLMNVSHAGLALVYVLLELRKKLNHHKKKKTKLLLRGSFIFIQELYNPMNHKIHPHIQFINWHLFHKLKTKTNTHFPGNMRFF